MLKKRFLAVGLGLGLSMTGAFVSLADWRQTAGDGRFQYVNEDGTLAKGMRQIEGKTYIFDNDGYMKTGWDYYNWCHYYMDATGAVQVGWVSVDNKWYYMNGEGVMQFGFLTLDKDIYFLNLDTGAMVTGVFEFEGYRYQAGADGKLIRSKKADNVRYDRDGRISYYNSKTKEWDYMPDSSDTLEIVKRGLENKYSEGQYYSNEQFESDAYQSLKTLLTEEEIDEFIEIVEVANEDIYERNANRYSY
ncbi:hypothetical protein AALB16_09860 [Lachnospiraceae bacterium 62-35]